VRESPFCKASSPAGRPRRRPPPPRPPPPRRPRRSQKPSKMSAPECSATTSGMGSGQVGVWKLGGRLLDPQCSPALLSPSHSLALVRSFSRTEGTPAAAHRRPRRQLLPPGLVCGRPPPGGRRRRTKKGKAAAPVAARQSPAKEGQRQAVWQKVALLRCKNPAVVPEEEELEHGEAQQHVVLGRRPTWRTSEARGRHE